MGDSHGMMAQVSAEQTVTGADKKDVRAERFVRGGPCSISDAGLSGAVATDVAGLQKMQGTRERGETDQPVKELRQLFNCR